MLHCVSAMLGVERGAGSMSVSMKSTWLTARTMRGRLKKSMAAANAVQGACTRTSVTCVLLSTANQLVLSDAAAVQSR